NALKLLNAQGEFIDDTEGKKILTIAENDDFSFAEVDNLGEINKNEAYIDIHIDEILDLPVINEEAIKKAGFKIVVDAVNSTGGIAIPLLLDRLGVQTVKLYCNPTGDFPHNPEPLKEHLTDLSQ